MPNSDHPGRSADDQPERSTGAGREESRLVDEVRTLQRTFVSLQDRVAAENRAQRYALVTAFASAAILASVPADGEAPALVAIAFVGIAAAFSRSPRLAWATAGLAVLAVIGGLWDFLTEPAGTREGGRLTTWLAVAPLIWATAGRALVIGPGVQQLAARLRRPVHR